MSEQGGEGKCSARVIRQTGRTTDQWDFTPCRRPAKFTADGKEWCWQHKPSGAEEILRRRETEAPTKPRFLNSRQVAERYGHTANWPRHCKDLRRIARKVGKNLIWRLDELEALETAQLRDERERAENKRIAERYKFDLEDITND